MSQSTLISNLLVAGGVTNDGTYIYIQNRIKTNDTDYTRVSKYLISDGSNTSNVTLINNYGYVSPSQITNDGTNLYTLLYDTSNTDQLPQAVFYVINLSSLNFTTPYSFVTFNNGVDYPEPYPTTVNGLVVASGNGNTYLYCSMGNFGSSSLNSYGYLARFIIDSSSVPDTTFGSGNTGPTVTGNYGKGYYNLQDLLSYFVPAVDDPENPVPAYYVSYNPQGIAADATYLYIACYCSSSNQSSAGKIVRMNLTDSTNDGGNYNVATDYVIGLPNGLPNGLTGLVLSNNNLYVLSTVNNTITKIDISDSENPTVSTYATLTGTFYGGLYGLTNYSNSFYFSNPGTGFSEGEPVYDGGVGSYGSSSPSSDTSLTQFDINGESVGTSGGGTVFLPYGTTSTTVDVTTTSSLASITVNDGDPSTGTISTSATGLVTGSNTVTVYVLAEDGVTTSTYYGYITVENPSSDTSLATFTIDDTPVTGGETIYVSYGITSVPVVVVTTSSAAYISVDLNEETPSIGTGSVTNTFSGLSVGSNTLNVNVLAQDGVTSQIYTVTINRNGAPSVPCFGENTKILCFNREKSLEEYVLIQDIRKGTLVKTLLNGYLPVDMIGKSTIHNHDNNERIKNRLYKCTKENYPELVYDELILTGCHSILVGELTHEQREKTMKELEKIYITDKNYRLLTFLDSRAETYQVEGEFPIYHLALENENYYMNYGIFANGLLVESCSKRYIKELSGMTLIE
jgi:hypothetical protein